MELLRFFRIDIGITLIVLAIALFVGSPEAAIACLLLIILEISISFDNAIVNATVLRRMNEFWQKMFLTVGILIAVFGMRLVFPIVIVAIGAGLGPIETIDVAFNDPDRYADELTEAEIMIGAFGGSFLMLVFLNFFFDDDKDVHWLGPVERLLARLGSVASIHVAITAGAVLAATVLLLDDDADKVEALISGIAGIVLYVLVKGGADALEGIEEEAEAPPEQRRHSSANMVANAGLASFLYLEVLDASFSFDGVIGAFAISKDILIITAGLGVGALFVRSMTVYLVRKGTLSEYRYLEHGAHWAIGALAVILILSIHIHTPEVITGLIGVAFIMASLVASIRWNKQNPDEPATEAEAQDHARFAEPTPAISKD